jgi:hypothetical protein
MNFSMDLMRFKKAAIVATAIASAICFAVESVQAGISKGKGSSTNASNFSFDLDDSTGIGNGYFPGAIQNFNIEPDSDFTNEEICGKEVCPPGDLTVTQLTTDSNSNITGLNFGLEGLNKLLENLDPNVNLSLGVIRYEVTFAGTDSAPELIWFINSKDINLINDVSSLSKFTPILGIFPSHISVSKNPDGTISLNNGGTFSFTWATEQNCVSVDSRQGWQTFTSQGQQYTKITSISGGWSVDSFNYSLTGSQGHTDPTEVAQLAPYNAYKLDQNYPFGALLLNIRNYGYFNATAQSTLPTPIIGEFDLRINDSDPSLVDNTGVLQVCFAN